MCRLRQHGGELALVDASVVDALQFLLEPSDRTEIHAGSATGRATRPWPAGPNGTRSTPVPRASRRAGAQPQSRSMSASYLTHHRPGAKHTADRRDSRGGRRSQQPGGRRSRMGWTFDDAIPPLACGGLPPRKVRLALVCGPTFRAGAATPAPFQPPRERPDRISRSAWDRLCTA